MSRILFITPGLYFDPTSTSTRLRYEVLSNAGHSGHVLCVVYKREHLEQKIGNFSLLGLYLPSFLQGYGTMRGLLRVFLYFFFCLYKTIILRKDFDVCISSDTFKSGALCLLAKLFTGIPYIIEVSGNYIKSFSVNSGNNSLTERLKHSLVLRISPVTVRHASAVKLLYEGQLDGLVNVDDPSKLHIFHNIVNLDGFHPTDSNKKLILSIGHPWYLKGMDILINAFKLIQNEIPDYHLKIVGYCADKNEFEQLASGNEHIELVNEGIPQEKIPELMGSCSIFVLASRTEAMGRVLLEAMASKKPVVASAVDGIPRIIRDGWNGLLFEPGNPDALARCLVTLVKDPDYADMLSSNAYADVYSRLSADSYIEMYTAMLAEAE